MEIIPEWAPSIHPMLVHFPIAILSIAILFDFISFFLPEKKRWWTSEATAILYGVGAVTAIGVYFTGQSAADSVFLAAEAQSVLNSHADWAMWTVWFYGTYALARILAEWYTPAKFRRRLHIMFFILSFAGLFLLYQTGDNGAKMVFKHGVGVQTAETGEENETTTVKADSEEKVTVETSFNLNEKGGWNWKIHTGAVTILREQFHFIEGSIEELNANVVQINNSFALQFSGHKLKGFFLTNDQYQNVQLDYFLDLSAFEGRVTLINHAQNADVFDYVSISSDGMVEQGRMNNDKKEVFEKGTADVTDSIFVRVVVNDTHFRGYIDKEMIVHGHGDAPATGNVGLRLDGSGSLLIEQIKLVQL